MHSFAWKLVSKVSKQVSRSLGPSWQPGVYNDTNQTCTTYFVQTKVRDSKASAEKDNLEFRVNIA